ncbi:MAG: HD domain-containing protein [Pseudomonadales bacterium]|nr:HD domain-containing protein [Pseudomonadales bacterium]MBO6597564.1 HD domain-containing protein [Pseudomonadales bacterium]MBO6657049.1 HD domain-containing protein [Pseudomonadales bacterium]MBO6824386.1 HD domain-containing protein [Pseudomonadales bacterium]
MNDLKTEKASIPIDLLSEGASPLISAWFELVHLKQLFRKGWLERGIPEQRCESVAEHTFGNVMLCVLLADQFPELDGEKVLRLAVLHDIGEAYVGDITPQDRVDSEEKSKRESEAVEKILSKLPNGERLINDWHEYERQSSPEAQFVKQIDRLELAMQASVYKKQGLVDSEDFMASAERGLKAPTMVEIMAALRALE